MADPVDLDESTLVWAAALVEDVDPAELLARVDVAVLARIVADVDEATAPIDAAARLLVRVVRDRPFFTGNAAIGWLAAVEVLAAGGWRVGVHRARVVRLCGDIREGVLSDADAAAVLRRWVVEDGMACPACGRRVYVRDAATGCRLTRLLRAPVPWQLPGMRAYIAARTQFFDGGLRNACERGVGQVMIVGAG